MIPFLVKVGRLQRYEYVRSNELIEEMADVLMHYNDVMLCYGITTDELKQAYIDKFERNMKRW